jgi:hypothetical protein
LPDTDLRAPDEFDWLDIDDTPETDLFSEKHEDIGVGSRFGDEDVEASVIVVVKGSRSVDILNAGSMNGATSSAPPFEICRYRIIRQVYRSQRRLAPSTSKTNVVKRAGAATRDDPVGG